MVKAPGNQTIWDLSLLPPATLQFLVVSDTHYILPDNAQAAEWSSVSEFPARTERALRLAADLPRDFAVHLGDISHEYPETGRAEVAQQSALDQFAELGLSFHQAAGNMDIGDKPDPTSPAAWVTQETLEGWHQRCGLSWFGFDAGDIHGMVLNTQIMNGPLQAAAEQQRWLEEDLEQHSSSRLMLFLHMPIFYVDRSERALGFYNSLDEPARSWLLDLIERYGIEMVFSGHTHTVEHNRHRACKMWVVPSTATSRAGLAEAYAVMSPDRGRGDVDKLGFYYVRETANGTSIHLVRSGRDTAALQPGSPKRQVMTRTSRDLPYGRIGIQASHPLGHANPGPVIWPSIVRQPVRDDFRWSSILEMGARFLRVPESDLMTPSESDRLQALRDEGVALEPYWIWTDRIDLVAEVLPRADAFDVAEIVMAGTSVPPESLIEQMVSLSERGVKIKLSPAKVEPIPGSGYHMRTRVGFLPEELPALEAALESTSGLRIRPAMRVMPDQSIAEQILGASRLASGRIAGVDWYLDFLSEDDGQNARSTAEAIAAIACVPGGRLVLGPHVDFDRSMDATRGLIDRLSNPNPPHVVARLLNSLLFGDSDDFTANEQSAKEGVEIRRGKTSVRLLHDGMTLLPDEMESLIQQLERSDAVQWYDLTDGTSERINSGERLRSLAGEAGGPVALVVRAE